MEMQRHRVSDRERRKIASEARRESSTAGIKRRLLQRPGTSGDCERWLRLAVKRGRVASKKVVSLGEELLMDRRPKGMSVCEAATYYVDALSAARLSFTPDDDRAWCESVQAMFDEKQSVIERTKATVVEQCRHQAAQISLVSVALQDAKTNNEWLWLPVRCYNRWSNWGERWCIAQIRTLSKPPVVVRACTDQFKLQEVKRLMDLLIISPFQDGPASGEIPLGSHRKGDIRWLCASYGWEITL